MKENKPQGLAQIADWARTIADACDVMNKTAIFSSRGFSEQTINALVEGGIDAPEHLLQKSEPEIWRIKGVGIVAMDQIRAYRAKFGREQAGGGSTIPLDKLNASNDE
jgi:hypothetical protein